MSFSFSSAVGQGEFPNHAGSEHSPNLSYLEATTSVYTNILATVPLLQGHAQNFHVLFWNSPIFLTVNGEPQSNIAPAISMRPKI